MLVMVTVVVMLMTMVVVVVVFAMVRVPPVVRVLTLALLLLCVDESFSLLFLALLALPYCWGVIASMCGYARVSLHTRAIVIVVVEHKGATGEPVGWMGVTL